MKKSRGKRAGFYAVLVFGVIAAVELLALGAYVIIFDEPFSYDRLQSQRLALFRPAETVPAEAMAGGGANPKSAPGEAGSGGASPQSAPGEAGSGGASPPPAPAPVAPVGASPPPVAPGGASSDGPRWVLHPYYGFVANPNNSGVNKFGFPGHEDQIQAASPDKLVVAVVGGSVALQLAQIAGDVLAAGLKGIPAFRGKQLVLLNLGNASFKQPQGLITLNDILSRGGHIDLLIALDGFNEIALPEAHGNLPDGISPFYPQHWRQLAESQLYPGQMSAIAKLQYATALRAILAENFARPVVRHLVTANLIWRVADQQLQNAAARYFQALDEQPPTDPRMRLTNDHRAFLGPTTQYWTRRALYMDIARQWGRSSVLMNDIIAAQGGRYFHFLQPNQYVLGGKPLGEQEQKIAINPSSPYRRPVEIGYPYLRAMGASLRRAGVWFEDLTGLFAGNGEEIYRDDCCHMNKDGNIRLARAIIAAIAARMASDDKPRSVALDAVDFSDPLFASPELRRFVPNPRDYNDGAADLIASGSTAPQPHR
jgi:hypothetical protein